MQKKVLVLRPLLPDAGRGWLPRSRWRLGMKKGEKKKVLQGTNEG